MKAYLTNIRKINNELHMLGIQNPTNLGVLENIKLISGQPVVAVVDHDKLLAFYIISKNGELFQTKGNIDLLFELDTIHDLSLININKYNSIRYFLTKIFYSLSIKEIIQYKEILESLENKIFYNYLHTEIDILKIKVIIRKEIVKSNLCLSVKNRLIDCLRKLRLPNNKILRKKIDLDLLGYGIYINTLTN